jgi:PAS domain S-box-containing protein
MAETEARDVKEAQLRQSEALFRTIFEQSPVSTQIFSPDGETIAVNPAWEARWGVTWDQVGRYNILEDQQLVEKGLMPYIKRGFAGEAVTLPPIQYVPDRTIPGLSAVPYRWTGGSIYPVKDQTGAVREVVLMHEDITERKQAEDALRESEQRFRAIFDGAPVGISLIDREGRYVAVNRVRQEMLGYTEAELMGRRYQDLTYPEDVAYDEQVNREAREQGQDRYQIEKRFLRKDGTVAWTRITIATVRDENGELDYSISIAEDITELKRVEEERKTLDQQKDQFLSAAAHDLRTPLTTIQGRIQLLQRRLDRPPLDPDRVRDDLGRMEVSAHRMAALINELLEVANIQLGRPVQLNRRPTDLVGLARSAVVEHRQATDKHRLSLETDEEELIGTWDPSRLERVLANLLSNAMKYSPNGGEVQVQVARAEDEGSSWALLTVRDQGIGIPASDLPYIFERFRRGQNVTGTIPGTGIGLAAVREIVEQHGGSVSVESEEGVGTSFRVRLPLVADRSAHPSPMI